MSIPLIWPLIAFTLLSVPLAPVVDQVLVEPPASPTVAPLSPRPSVSVPPNRRPRPAVECPPGTELQAEFGCVAVQLPDETAGRAYG